MSLSLSPSEGVVSPRAVGGPEPLQSRTFPARMAIFPEVRDFAEGVCRAAGFERDDCARVVLLLEELFTNTVVHGHGGDSDESVHLSFELAEGRIALTYEDMAPRHDPFAVVRPPCESSSVEERPVGGLGVVLVSTMADRVGYAHIRGRNLISVVMTPSAPRPVPGPGNPA
jgi:anti-sigma regulatory factor (Ser/Thr protein kinase)